MKDKTLFEVANLEKWTSQGTRNPLRALRLQSLPDCVLKLCESQPACKADVHLKENLLAVLTDVGDVEIRRLNDVKHVLARSRSLGDEFPEWRKLCWTQSGSLLLLARSVPVVDVFEPGGNYCHCIPLEESLPEEFLPENSVAQVSTFSSNEAKWSDMMVTLQFNGSFRGFFIGRFSGYMPAWRMDFPLGSDNLSTHFQLCPDSGLVYLASLSTLLPVSPDPTSPSQLGLSIWRKIDDEKEAFSSLDPSNPLQTFSDGILGKIFWWRKKEKVCIVCMDLNENKNELVVISSQGIVSLFQTPTLRPLRTFPNLDASLPAPVDAIWWSNLVLLVKKKNGGVNFVGVGEDEEGWGQELMETESEVEFVAPLSTLICPALGICYVLEEEAEWVGSGETESDAWVVARMAGLLFYGWLKLGMGWAVGQPLEDVSRPSPHSLTLHSVHTTLRSIVATTPMEIFRKKLNLGDYGEALDLAKAYSLDTDQVYKRRWEESSFDKHAVKDFLAKITDKAYVRGECLTRTPTSPEGWESLLNHGIRVCDEESSSSKVAMEDVQKTVLKLKYHKLILDIYERMLLRDEFISHMYLEMRDLSLVDLAVYVIQKKRFDWLPVLGSEEAVDSHWLPILSLIPEVTPISDYSHLLPFLKDGVVVSGLHETERSAGRNSLSQVKTSSMKQDWKEMLQSSEIYTWYPGLQQFRKSDWDIPLVNNWYKTRLARIEELSGVPETSLDFVRCAVANGFSALESEKREIETFATLSYGCGDISLSLKQFRSLEPQAMIRRITSRETLGGESVVEVEGLLLCYLTYSEEVGRCSGKGELAAFTRAESKESLSFLLSLMRGPQRKADNLIDKLRFGVEEQVALIEECLIECELKGEVVSVTASKILACVPEPSVLELTGHEGAAQTIHGMTNLLQCLDIMNIYGVSLTVAEVKESMESRSESEKKLTRLVLKATTGSHVASRWKLPEWMNLQKEVLTLREQIFSLVPEQRCMEIFVRGMLSSGSPQVIMMAGNFCEDPENEDKTQDSFLRLTNSVAATQVLAAAEDYVHGASRFEDEGITLAVQCLTSVLTTRPPEFGKLLNVISGISLLEEMKVEELPSRILMSTDRARYIQLALEADLNNYREATKLLKIGNLLGCFSEKGESHQAEILRLCSRKALDMLDYKTASKYCQELVSSKSSIAWDVCFELATSGECSSRQLTLELCQFVLLHAPESYLSETLQHQLNLKVEDWHVSLDLEADDFKNDSTISDIIEELNLPNYDFVWDAALDPIYAQTYSQTHEECEISGRHLKLLQHFSTNTRSSGPVLKEILMRISRDVLGFSTTWGISLILSMKDTSKTENLLRSAPNPALAYTGLLYIACLQMTAGTSPQVWELEPRRLVEMVVRERERFGESPWKHLLVTLVENGPWDEEGRTTKLMETNPEADPRFLEDPEYRNDTILGISMTLDDEAFARACSLAEEFNLDLWEVAMSSLEFLLTSPDHSVSELADKIKSRKLPSLLSTRPDRLRDAMLTSVLPLIPGTDHSRLVLYYMILEKASLNSPVAKEAQVHRTLIRHFSKVSKEIDYQRLASQRDLIPILTGKCNSSNIQPLSKLITKIPGTSYSHEEIQVAELFTQCWEAIEKGGIEEFTEKLRELIPALDGSIQRQLLRAILAHSSLFSGFEKEVEEISEELLDLDDKASIDSDEEMKDMEVDTSYTMPDPQPPVLSSFPLPSPLSTFSNYGLVRRRKQ